MRDASALFSATFGAAPTVVATSPGRINLIGDHVDYCGLPVLPMAIKQAIEIAADDPGEAELTAISSQDGKAISSQAGPDQPGWARYVLAVLDQIRPLAPQRGARLAIDSDLPSTGGLSSSSALAVGCVVALNDLWDLALSPAEIIATSLAAEQVAAIAGGAMDQTVITLARPGHALRIDFDPPAHRHIPLPSDFAWVAGYSGVKAPKGASAADSYHSFVLASRAAAALLSGQPVATGGPPPLLSRVSPRSPAEVAALPTITVEEAAAMTGGDDLSLAPDRLLDIRVSAQHVLSEAARVDAAELALEAADMANMGTLMNESHESLRRYGSSTPELDRLVAAARSAGATGARVTGAGFGGWAIALCPPDRADQVDAAMEAACGGPTFAATAEGGALWSLNAR